MSSQLAARFLIGCLVGLGTVSTSRPTSGEETDDQITFFGTLAPWKYPDAKFSGASMSDGNNPRLQTVKFEVILTTGDSFEKVAKFYADQIESARGSGVKDAKVDPKAAEAKVLSTQDDSQGRPLKLRVIVINRDTTATTVVLSRADSEQQTHIVWSHYMHFGTKP